jgi:hypothetical protein
MTTTQSFGERDTRADAKPYAMVGAGALTSAIWKSGDDTAGWHYSFNVFRMSPNGTVEQRFCPHDLAYLLNLVRVIAAVIAEDGCLPAALRSELERLESLLDQIRLIEG